ncbi:uncharacterized protein [Scyliorhinus torazame]|uniref:uncharacterized protein isoform X2 n=1 Tax=Scyliorhinus torazame TaxID=75743 RepID=UPI003B5C8651
MAECGTAEDLREDALIDFLAKKGGRVKNRELVERFKKFINAPEPLLKAKYRDVFKDIVNKIALVKQEDGEKYIVLKKKYQQFVRERDGCNKEEKMTLSTPVEESVQQLQKGEVSTHSREENLESSNAVAPKVNETSPKENTHDIDISKPLSSQICAGNPTAETLNMCEWIVQELPTADTKSKASSERSSEYQGEIGSGKRGKLNFENSICKENINGKCWELKAEAEEILEEGETLPSQTECPSICCSEAFKEKQGKECDTASEGDAAYSLQIEVKVEEPQEEEFDSVFKDDSEQNGFEDGSGSIGSPSVALDPLEKEWLKCAASGHLTALCDLLRQDPSLAAKKDFTSVSDHVYTSGFYLEC